MRHAAPPMRTSTRCRCSRKDPAARRQTRVAPRQSIWRCLLLRIRCHSSQGAARSPCLRWRGTLRARYPSTTRVVPRQRASPNKLSRGEAVVAGPSRWPRPQTLRMRRHRKARRLSQTRRAQGTLLARRSVSPHRPQQTASSAKPEPDQPRRPKQQLAPREQEQSRRRLLASGPQRQQQQGPGKKAGMLGAAKAAPTSVLAASQPATRRCAPRAPPASGARTPRWERARTTAAGRSAGQ